MSIIKSKRIVCLNLFKDRYGVGVRRIKRGNMRGVVRLGDMTTHGGCVIQASSEMVVQGRQVALVGDLVSCPKKGHGVNPIIEGSSMMSFSGRAVAVDGCKCACGCSLISSLPSVGSEK